MDDIVKQAMAKWPNVPHCCGWLGLDARGQWFMRDDRAQRAGPFAGGGLAAKGAVLRHEKLIDFIGRNYLADDSGRWFFQNGPQRVFVELEATPWVWRVADGDFAVSGHTGQCAGAVEASLLDEAGRLYLLTQAGFGLVHTLDVSVAANAVEQGLWVPEAVDSTTLPARFGYVVSPQALGG